MEGKASIYRNYVSCVLLTDVASKKPTLHDCVGMAVCENTQISVPVVLLHYEISLVTLQRALSLAQVKLELHISLGVNPKYAIYLLVVVDSAWKLSSNGREERRTKREERRERRDEKEGGRRQEGKEKREKREARREKREAYSTLLYPTLRYSYPTLLCPIPTPTTRYSILFDLKSLLLLLLYPIPNLVYPTGLGGTNLALLCSV